MFGISSVVTSTRAIYAQHGGITSGRAYVYDVIQRQDCTVSRHGFVYGISLYFGASTYCIFAKTHKVKCYGTPALHYSNYNRVSGSLFDGPAHVAQSGTIQLQPLNPLHYREV